MKAFIFHAASSRAGRFYVDAVDFHRAYSAFNGQHKQFSPHAAHCFITQAETVIIPASYYRL
jgi:hypothetical protein